MEFNKEKLVLSTEQLFDAVKQNNLGKVRKIINQGASINAQEVSIYGKEPIHIAAENNNKNIIEFLLSKGVSVDEIDKNGWTPLHYAASKDCLEVAKFLIEKGADINAKNIYGKKPIQRAAEDNSKNIIELLLSKGVSVNDTDKDGRTPLYWASWSGRLDVVKYLIGKGANISAKDKDDKTPLDTAIDKKHDNVEKYLKQTELDKKLLTAAENGDLSEVKKFVGQGANVNAKDKDGKTPLHYASQSFRHLDAVKYLRTCT